MTRREKQKTSKANRNYYLNLISIVPFLLLLASGIIVLRYHGGMDYELETMGLNGHNWLIFHQVLAVVVIPLIVIHLWFHAYWIKKLFSFKKNKGKNNDMNFVLFIVFILTAVTALLSWLVLKDSSAADLLREIHNKLGLALIFFFIVHLRNYFKWLLTMTLKVFSKTNKKNT